MEPHREVDTTRFRHPDALGLPPEPQGGQPSSQPAEPRSGRMPKPPRRGRGMFRKFVVFLMILAIAGFALYVGYIVSIVAKVSTVPLQLGGLSTDSAGRTNILVMGVGDPGHAGEGLSDTMMIWSLDKTTGQMAQISIPRDLRVQIPGHGYGKINSANVYGGVTVAKQTVSNTFDIPIDYYVKTDFNGLKDMVDAVGGIDVDVKERLSDPDYPCADNQYKSCGLLIEPGLQHMDGARALEYVRCRKGTCGNDFGRAARQQEVIGLLRPKLTDPNLLWQPAKLKLIAQAAHNGIETDLGFIQMLYLANALKSTTGQDPIRFVLSTAPGGLLRSDPSGSSDLLPIGRDFSAVAERVQTIFTDPPASN